MKFDKYVKFQGKILIVGFGSIGPAVVPLILRHIDIAASNITIVAADDSNQEIAASYGIKFECKTLDETNYAAYCQSKLQAGDLLLNLSVNISSLALILLCHELQALYLDTSIERWASEKSLAESLYQRRTKVMMHKDQLATGASALICHGANPGLVSHIAKQALLDVAEKITGIKPSTPTEQNDWARLFKETGIVTLHIAERDTQISDKGRRPNEFVNTWSIDGLLDESFEYTGFSWGTHEHELPEHLVQTTDQTDGCRFIQLARYGATTKVRSWIDSHGIYHGFVIPHAEAFSLAEYFCYLDESTQQSYHPTVHYVYQPCNDALVSLHDAVAQYQHSPSFNKRLLHEDIVEGKDELGVLVLRHNSAEVYWLGSKLSIAEARNLVTHNNATSLQVAVSVLAGMVYIMQNPQLGLIEAEQCDFKAALAIAQPYLGDFSGHWGIWPEQGNNYSWTFKELAVNLG